MSPVTEKTAGSIPVRSASCGPVAQLVEQWTENPCVAGSIPAWTTMIVKERLERGVFFYIIRRKK